MACSACGSKAISKSMGATKSSTIPQKTLGSNSAAVFSNTSPRMVSHSRAVTQTIKPGTTVRVAKVGK